MKTIIAGSRTFDDYQLLSDTMTRLEWEPSEIVSGGARGADTLGEKWAAVHHIPLTVFPAAWDLWGRSAGYVRNQQMADYVGRSGGLVAFWDGSSRGTMNMIKLAEEKGMRVKVVTYESKKTNPVANI